MNYKLLLNGTPNGMSRLEGVSPEVQLLFKFIILIIVLVVFIYNYRDRFWKNK